MLQLLSGLAMFVGGDSHGIPRGSQAGLLIEAVAEDSRTGVQGALVISARLRSVEVTDRLGRARFAVLPRPDTLRVLAVGFAPKTVLVDQSSTTLQVRLSRRAVTLTELTVSGDPSAMLGPSSTGRWLVPGTLIRAFPAAIEADPMRALAAVPSVTFSSPLSARPVIRGYDAADGAVRLDGFEIHNPYHIGRVFSAFPAEATESAAVSPIAVAGSDGGTLAGIVDMVGRSAQRPGDHAAAELSMVSATASAGTQPGRGTAFGAMRVAFIEDVTGIVGEGIPYDFQDLYARVHVESVALPTVDLTLYGAHDALGRSESAGGMEWSNVLMGQRWRAVDGPRLSVDLAGSWNRFSLDAFSTEARNSKIDITNRFRRATLSAHTRYHVRDGQLSVGVELGHRAVFSRVAPVQGDDFASMSDEIDLLEVSSFMSVRREAGPLTVEGGLRLDASQFAARLQPRGRLVFRLSRGLSAALNAARQARLFQVITDPQAEPSLAFYDFWLTAGSSTVPVPAVTHVTAEVDVVVQNWSAHVAAFVSRGSGIAELRPVWDQRTAVTAFRYGMARSGGVEARVVWAAPALRGGAIAGTYVLSATHRRWENAEWIPWRLDRRHALRVQVHVPIARRWTLFVNADGASGQPLTPVHDVVRTDAPIVDGQYAPFFRRIGYRYAREGQARSDGTLHLDMAARVALGGPGASRIHVGLSVLNLTFGPVAPQVPVTPGELFQPGATSFPEDGVPYKRLFTLPPVPSFSCRIQF